MKVTAKRRKGFAHSVTARHHSIVTDEPEDAGGADSGPRPTELLAMSLASCTAITVEMYADRKGIELEQLEVEVDYRLDPKAGHSDFTVIVKLPAGLSEEEVERLRVIAGKCPVHRTLIGDVNIVDRVQQIGTA